MIRCLRWRTTLGTPKLVGSLAGRGFGGLPVEYSLHGVTGDTLSLGPVVASDVSRATFQGAVEPHLPCMHRAAARILGRPDLASDVVQEALWALNRLSTPPANLRGWLLKAVVHRSLHSARSERRRCHHEGALALARPRQSDPGCTECEREEQRRIVATALAGLSEEHREILMLSAAGDWDYSEMGRQLNLPVGTVRSRLARARAGLRRALKPHAEALGVCPWCDSEGPSRRELRGFGH